MLSNPFIIIDEISQKLNEINSSISSTLSTINTNINSVKTDVSSVKTVCNNIYDKVDTEISSLLTNTNTNNTANLTGTLSQKLSYIANNLIGAVSQTGGTYNTGTVNAKLATLILNLDSTKFVAGTVFTKYNPVTSALGLPTTSSGYNSQWIYKTVNDYNSESDVYVYIYENTDFSFKPNKSGTVRMTVTGTSYSSTYYLVVYVTTTSGYSNNAHNGAKVTFTSTTSTTKTVDFDVVAGTTYYIKCAKKEYSYAGDVSSIKISYSLSTDTTLL